MWKCILIATTALYLLCLSMVISTMVSEAEVDLTRAEVKITNIEGLMESIHKSIDTVSEETKLLRTSVERMTGGINNGQN